MKRSRLSLPRPRDKAARTNPQLAKDQPQQQRRGRGGGKCGDNVHGFGSPFEARGNVVDMSALSKVSVLRTTATRVQKVYVDAVTK